jgi:hypothetical protein
MSRGEVFRLAGLAIVLAVTVAVAVVLVLDRESNVDQDEPPTSDIVADVDDAEDDTTPVATDDEGEATPGSDPINTPEAEVADEPRTITGRVTHGDSDQPLAGVTVEATGDDDTPITATTDDEGYYELADVPPGATLTFSLEGYHEYQAAFEGGEQIDVALHPSVLAGTIVTSTGEPIWDATVASGDELTWTDEDGSFRIEDIPDDGDIVFKAPGYAARVIPIDEVASEVTLEEKPIYGIYAAGAIGAPDRFTELLDLIDRTELNAIVVDIKDSAGYVFYDTEVEMAQEANAVLPVYDAERMVQEIKDRGIYAIARIVIFEDPVLAEARPDLAIQDSREGGVWETFTGIAWMNPYREEVWEYNIELMKEAVELGFDEVQLDYMRFPTDGPLNRADYGQESNAETRDRAIAEFLEAAYEALAPTPAYLTGDIFGMTLWDPTEGEIGQNLVTVTERLDYVHPMIYPSHFFEGAMGFEIPNDHPYEVIKQSLDHGMQYLPERLKPKIRPWLQDFNYGVGIEYGDEEVREQIRASEDFGASGWMLWNAGASYHEGALRPAE